MPRENFLVLLEREKDNILNMLPGDQADASDVRAKARWWALAGELMTNPSLAEAAANYPGEMLVAVKRLAEWGLIPDGEEAFINVYGGHPEAEAMYKGMIRRAVEAGAISHTVGDVIRVGDIIEEEVDQRGRVLKVKRPPLTSSKTERELIGAYALFWLPNNLMDYEIFERGDIERVKAAALRNARRKKRDAELSPAWQFSEGEQAKKSVLKRGLKRMRGRRDTDAGQRYDSMVTASTRYDVETSGSTIDPPIEIDHVDDGPKGRNVTPNASDNKLKLENDALPAKGDRPLTQDEMNEVLAVGTEAGLKLTQVFPIIGRVCGVEDISEVMLSSKEKLKKAIAQAADASAMDDASHLQKGA